ncbi:hypothetical protein Cni_G14873 [Canna indica]|uniref:DNA-directed RNA polymerase subunit n=1 Tax=Canna indica TaxID=4628 RepID=A0AAQ3QB18_9LILI|nr:hypothetical protein Cni_G14873 [Canna indica]
MEGLTVAETDLAVYVHPSKGNNIRQAVLRQLSSLLFTYDEVFDGVILAYEVDIGDKRAKILSGLIPYIGVQVKANLLLFSPRPGMLLDGKVVKLGKESIHVVVLGFASAAIILEDIRKEFKFKNKHGGVFVSSSHKRHTIKAGNMIRFLVKSFDEEIIHISGSLAPPNTGCIQWLSKHGAEDGSHSNRSPKKMEDVKREMHAEGTIDSTVADKSMNPTRPHKSKKRTRED